MKENQRTGHDRMFIFLLVLAVSSTIGLLGWRTLLNNYAVDVLGMEGHQIGLLQGVREIPGFLTLLVIYLLLLIKEVRLASLSIIIFGIGIGITGIMPSFFGILAMTVIMSFGFHFYAALGQSLGLQYYDQDTAPIVFGKLRGYAAGGSIVMAIIIFFLSKRLDFAWMFGLVGLAITAAGLWCFFQDPSEKDLVPQQKKMIFKAKYWLFYALTFMSGARRQIFVAFAIFLLVQKFHYTVSEISLLFVITNIIAFFSSPLIGKAIARFGERKVLSAEYSSLFLIFFAYAFVDSKLIIGILYVLDHLFFNFSIAINTFFQKISDPEDIGSSMAVGFTINHIAAVVLPVLGGIVWMIDYKITFIGGMFLAFISLLLTQFTTRQTRAKTRA
ncbi:MAG: MFS transporter [Deltaproteobacteria bacterium]|nr:MFS transporter [Deltaproteobacteria bacterium]